MNWLETKLRSSAGALVHDLIMIPLAWFLAYWLRYNLGYIPEEMLASATHALAILLPVQASVFWYFGLYRGVWRFASVQDLARIVKAVLTGLAISVILIFLLTRLENIPRSVFPLYGVLLILLLGGPRLLYRWKKDHRIYDKPGKKVLIVGAGEAGEMLMRDLSRDRSALKYSRRADDPVYSAAVFVDDDPAKQGREIHGLPVVGPCEQIPDIVEEYDIALIIIALPSADSQQMRRVVGICEKAGVMFRTLPHMQDIVSGRVTVNELREVSIEDLLGRETVDLDWGAIHASLTGKRIMISGGGGSIGSELCRQLAKINPHSLIVYERNEFNLYQIELELRKSYPELELYAYLGDVCAPASVSRVLDRHQPDVIFHAAAYKHVPMLEHQIREAVANNVLGTQVLAEQADRFGCKTFVLISTDKAVNPTNIMGASKRAAEIYCQNFNDHSNTRFITVRFGNVLGSAGSVLPLFREQIAQGGPVTVTHPEITRYFMTIPEASQLIMQAEAIGEGGEIFVLDMGKPVKIAYLAEQLIRLSGKEPGRDIEIRFTGLRPGEKLYEELFHESEQLKKTSHTKVLLAKSREVAWEELRQTMDSLQDACASFDETKLKQIVALLVPEYIQALSSSVAEQQLANASNQTVQQARE